MLWHFTHYTMNDKPRRKGMIVTPRAVYLLGRYIIISINIYYVLYKHKARLNVDNYLVLLIIPISSKSVL